MGIVIDATSKFQDRRDAADAARRKNVMAAIIKLVNSRPNMKAGVVALIRQEQDRRLDK